MKWFGVLRFLERTLFKCVNKILVVIAYLCNNMDPLIGDTNCYIDLESGEFDNSELNFDNIATEDNVTDSTVVDDDGDNSEIQDPNVQEVVQDIVQGMN